MGDFAGNFSPLLDVQGFDPEAVSYNMKLLIEAGLIGGNVSRTIGIPAYCLASSMTWQGHELLDKIRAESLWNKIKAGARERALPLSFEAGKFLAEAAIKSLI